MDFICPDLFYELCQHLTFKEIHCLSQTCKKFYQYAKTDPIKKLLNKKKYFIREFSLEKTDLTNKTIVMIGKCKPSRSMIISKLLHKKIFLNKPDLKNVFFNQ